MNYREKYGKDVHPSERDSEEFLKEAKAIVEEYNLGDTINYLIEYVD